RTSTYMLPAPPSTLFPYTTLFRSARLTGHRPGDPQGDTRRCLPLDRRAVRIGRRPGYGDVRRGTAMTSNDVQRRTPRTNPVLNLDRKSTRLNSSHVSISYAVFCLK